MSLKTTFLDLFARYTDDKTLSENYWAEIEKHYSAKSRHYHTLTHLENLLAELEGVKSQISDWEVVLFALFYHDLIYKSSSAQNEENSAKMTQKRLNITALTSNQIDRTVAHILATKKHEWSNDSDTTFFTDADLSILGAPFEHYMIYSRQIRKEYAIYPDLLYNPGRKKVLIHFLAMERIYNTPHFYEKYEAQARQNLAAELLIL
jgi:predicted metal-dependent HD superfamily phosphohydrolase